MKSSMKLDMRQTGVTVLLFYVVFMVLSGSFNVFGYGVTIAILKIQNIRKFGVIQFFQSFGLSVAVIVAMLVVFKWLRTDLTKNIICRKGQRKMSGKAFVVCILLLFAAQYFFLGFSNVLDIFLRLFDMSLQSEISSAQGEGQPSIQFLYTLLLSPVAEELLFRGAVFQVLRKYGRIFAIVASAALFGIYHGNLPQGMFAFAAGILLAYITAEYSIYWSVLFHILNNANSIWLNYGVSAIGGAFLGGVTDIVYMAALAFCIWFIFKNRKEIKKYMRKYPTLEGAWSSLFRSHSVIAFTILNVITAIYGMV